MGEDSALYLELYLAPGTFQAWNESSALYLHEMLEL
jgi:hypothetical protein